MFFKSGTHLRAGSDASQFTLPSLWALRSLLAAPTALRCLTAIAVKIERGYTMKSFRMCSWLFLAVALILFSGCATKKYTSRQFNTVQNQLDAMNSSLVQLESSDRENRAAIQRLQSQAVPSKSMGGMYRTPSGFELPAIQIQQALKNSGYYQGDLNGVIDERTRKAVIAFQRDNGLAADGIVGRQTWSKLKTFLGTIK